jgi:hypothetical protein
MYSPTSYTIFPLKLSELYTDQPASRASTRARLLFERVKAGAIVGVSCLGDSTIKMMTLIR